MKARPAEANLPGLAETDGPPFAISIPGTDMPLTFGAGTDGDVTEAAYRLSIETLSNLLLRLDECAESWTDWALTGGPVVYVTDELDRHDQRLTAAAFRLPSAQRAAVQRIVAALDQAIGTIRTAMFRAPNGATALHDGESNLVRAAFSRLAAERPSIHRTYLDLTEALTRLRPLDDPAAVDSVVANLAERDRSLRPLCRTAARSASVGPLDSGASPEEKQRLSPLESDLAAPPLFTAPIVDPNKPDAALGRRSEETAGAQSPPAGPPGDEWGADPRLETENPFRLLSEFLFELLDWWADNAGAGRSEYQLVGLGHSWDVAVDSARRLAGASLPLVQVVPAIEKADSVFQRAWEALAYHRVGQIHEPEELAARAALRAEVDADVMGNWVPYSEAAWEAARRTSGPSEEPQQPAPIPNAAEKRTVATSASGTEAGQPTDGATGPASAGATHPAISQRATEPPAAAPSADEPQGGAAEPSFTVVPLGSDLDAIAVLTRVLKVVPEHPPTAEPAGAPEPQRAQRSESGTRSRDQTTIWYLGGRNFQAGDDPPQLVSETEKNLLLAFLDRGRERLSTKELEQKVTNVSATFTKLRRRSAFAPAMRGPEQKGDGYSILVKRKPPSS